MASSASKFEPIGPAHVLIGDPTQASGAGMTLLEKVESATVAINPRSAFTSDDQRGGVPLATGLYTLASQPEVQVSLSEAGLDTLEALLVNATRTTSKGKTDVVGFLDKFEAVAAADIPTVAVIPVTQEADGSSAENGIWLPAVMVQSLDGFQFGRVEPGEIQQNYNVAFQSAYAEVDQGDTAIPTNNRVGFMGDPATLGLTWSLPTLT